MSGKSRGILKFKVRDNSIPVLTFCMCLCFVLMPKMFVSFSSLAYYCEATVSGHETVTKGNNPFSIYSATKRS